MNTQDYERFIPTPPAMSLDQRRAALVRANEVRAARRALKADVRTGRVDWRQVVLCPASEFQTMPVVVLLLAVPAIGKAKAELGMHKCGVATTRTLGRLTDREREALVNHRFVTGRAPTLSVSLSVENRRLREENQKLRDLVDRITERMAA